MRTLHIVNCSGDREPGRARASMQQSNSLARASRGPAPRELIGGGIMQAARFGSALLLITTLVASAGCAPSASHPSVEQDMKGIERLHEQDKEATLADSADLLAKLWDKDAVRFLPDHPAEIGAAVIYADDKKWE